MISFHIQLYLYNAIRYAKQNCTGDVVKHDTTGMCMLLVWLPGQQDLTTIHMYSILYTACLPLSEERWKQCSYLKNQCISRLKNVSPLVDFLNRLHMWMKR